MFHRKVTSSRSITIPKALAVQTGINVNTPVDIYSDGGKIVIEKKKNRRSCAFLNDTAHLDIGHGNIPLR